MNKDNAKDYLPLVQALAEGKTVQYKSHLGEWGDVQEVTFTAAFCNYRVKPAPIERWGVVNKSGKFLTTYEDKEIAAQQAGYCGGRYFLMREVV